MLINLFSFLGRFIIIGFSVIISNTTILSKARIAQENSQNSLYQIRGRAIPGMKGMRVEIIENSTAKLIRNTKIFLSPPLYLILSL
jgi:hypothetical protein